MGTIALLVGVAIGFAAIEGIKVLAHEIYVQHLMKRHGWVVAVRPPGKTRWLYFFSPEEYENYRRGGVNDGA